MLGAGLPARGAPGVLAAGAGDALLAAGVRRDGPRTPVFCFEVCAVPDDVLAAAAFVRGGTDVHAGTSPAFLGGFSGAAAAAEAMLTKMVAGEARRRSLRETKERTRFLDEPARAKTRSDRRG